MKLSSRGDVPSFIVMDVMEAAREAEAVGRDIIHMEVGQPASAAPAKARAVLARALEAGPLGYTVALGLPELRSRIARHYGEWYNIDLNPERVVITAGASGAFLLSFSALFETGARVGLGLPCYPSYRHILSALGMEPVGLRTSPKTRFQPRPDQLEGLEGLIVASPGNPTGTMIGGPELSALAEACAAQDVALISDEIYHGLAYGQECVTALSVTDEVHVINSFSKYFSMTGWRIGWMVVPEAHIRQVERLAQNYFICPSHAGQVLALESMDCAEELDAIRDGYGRNRDLLLQGLRDIGFTTLAPADGAFYIYADCRHLGADSLTVSRQILEEVGVAVTPGLDFDPEEGRHWLRFSYARSAADMATGLERLRAYVKSRGAKSSGVL